MNIKYSIYSLAIILCLGAMAGCSKNPVSSINPDQFAQAVNHYEDLSISHKGISENCGNYYVNPDQVQSIPVLKEEFEKSCPQQMEKLAVYLSQNGLSGITADMLKSKDIWQVYFQSKHARGK